MKCKKCEQSGKKSTVRINRNQMCCLVIHYNDDYYDEDGKHHFHGNPCNQNNDTATCSNNHRWELRNISRCWCGWKSDDGEDEIWLPDRKELKEGQAYYNDEPIDVIRAEGGSIIASAEFVVTNETSEGEIHDIDLGTTRRFKSDENQD